MIWEMILFSFGDLLFYLEGDFGDDFVFVWRFMILDAVFRWRCAMRQFLEQRQFSL